MILEKFLEDYGIELKKVENIRFRVKNNFALEQNYKRFAIPTITDNYLLTFLNSTTYTENCYECNFARLERAGDITLGDSWGSELVLIPIESAHLRKRSPFHSRYF